MHHTRRKSGQGAASAPNMDARAPAHRSRTSGSSKKVKEGSRAARSPKEIEREYNDYWDDDGGRDTFPQYCMTCEKQFLPPDDTCIYCSEACREYDSTTPPSLLRGSASNGYAAAPLTHYSQMEARDIVPRASPSRPTQHPGYFPAPAPNDAVTALRSLTIRPASPSGGWPFGEKYSATYDAAYGRRGSGGYGYAYGSSGEGPLPSRKQGYSSKNKELVRPVVGR